MDATRTYPEPAPIGCERQAGTAGAAELVGVSSRLLGEVVQRLDLAGDRFARATRRRPRAHRAMYALSGLGDDGRVWIAASLVEAWRSEDARRSFAHSMVCLGVESALVNGPMKLLIRRPRPLGLDEHTHHLRLPSDSSFPSGHSASAATMAMVLGRDSPLAPLWWALAVGITVSRVHVGVHHATDVLGGFAVGIALGAAGRALRPGRSGAAGHAAGAPTRRGPLSAIIAG